MADVIVVVDRSASASITASLLDLTYAIPWLFPALTTAVTASLTHQLYRHRPSAP